MSEGAFDTHSHLQDEELAGDFDGILERALRAGVEAIALCGYDAPSNDAALALAGRSEAVFPTVGFHPHEADRVSPGMLAELESLAGLPGVVAVGEIGLDFYRNLSSHAAQRRLIDAQLALALRVGKPVCVHSRAAEDAAIEHLGPFATEARARGLQIPGVMHCFGGTVEQAAAYLEAGYLISIACPVTYPKNTEAHRLVRAVPLERLVIETDSPYLPPQTRRGQLNEPANVIEVAKAIAELRGESLQRILAATTANARRLFQLPVLEGAAA